MIQVLTVVSIEMIYPFHSIFNPFLSGMANKKKIRNKMKRLTRIERKGSKLNLREEISACVMKR